MKGAIPFIRALVPTLLALTRFVAANCHLRSSIREWVLSPIQFGELTPRPGFQPCVNTRTVFCIIQALFLIGLAAPTLAQEVSFPDPGLNAAVRAALQKPFDPLTEQDLLSLTNLNASRRNVRSIEGLEAARNLVTLDLQINRLTNFSLPSELTKLITLDVSVNPLTSFSLPSGLTNLASLTLESDGLTNLTVPAGLTRLINLDLENNGLTSFNQL